MLAAWRALWPKRSASETAAAVGQRTSHPPSFDDARRRAGRWRTGIATHCGKRVGRRRRRLLGVAALLELHFDLERLLVAHRRPVDGFHPAAGRQAKPNLFLLGAAFLRVLGVDLDECLDVLLGL